MYTIKFKQHDQDNLNFIPFKKGDKMPSFLDYNEVLQSSIKRGYIENENEIETLVDGSDHTEPYFTSMSAAADCEATLSGDYPEIEFDAMQTVYEVF